MPDETARPSGLLLCCPSCGATLALPNLSTKKEDPINDLKTHTRAPEARGRTEDATAALPTRAAAPIKAPLWSRALAIAHRVIDEYPGDGTSQAEAFKAYCLEQGLDYGLQPGPHGRPLYARALDAAHAQRQRRRKEA